MSFDPFIEALEKMVQERRQKPRNPGRAFVLGRKRNGSSSREGWIPGHSLPQDIDYSYDVFIYGVKTGRRATKFRFDPVDGHEPDLLYSAHFLRWRQTRHRVIYALWAIAGAGLAGFIYWS